MLKDSNKQLKGYSYDILLFSVVLSGFFTLIIMLFFPGLAVNQLGLGIKTFYWTIFMGTSFLVWVLSTVALFLYNLGKRSRK